MSPVVLATMLGIGHPVVGGRVYVLHDGHPVRPAAFIRVIVVPYVR